MANTFTFQQEVTDILTRFSKEAPEIRNEVAALLPSYNDLLNMHALSFSEFALMPAAEAQGLDHTDPLFDYASVLPPCPKCKSHHVVRKAKFSYQCKSCDLFFTPNWNSISSGCKAPAVTFLKVLRCMLDYYSVSRTCEACGIAINTFYNIRNRLFYGMEQMLKDVKLYGVCRCDNTFMHTNFRGENLSDPDYPEDSPFDRVDFVPRAAKSRGGAGGDDRALSSVCIFAAVDEFNHVTAKFIGVGAANAALLKEAIGDKFLLEVPDKDPSPLPPLKRKKHKERVPSGTASLLVSDGESAIARFASRYGIAHESHVYRRNGTQMRLSGGSHDIQQVNALHSRLKRFLRDVGCSSKYLPGYLTFFEWIENFKASDEAIRLLFLILAAPGKGRSPGFFKEQYVIPNYLTQWCQSDNPLRKLSYEKLLAYVLYKQRREAIVAGDNVYIMPMEEISFRTGYTEQTIRRNYKNLYASGYDALISEHFNAPKVKQKTKKVKTFACHSVSKEMLAIFDEYAKNVVLPKAVRLTDKAFEGMINKKYGTEYKIRNLKYSFGFIVKKGLRPALPKRTTYARDHSLTPAEKKWIELYRSFESLKLSYREAGRKVPLRRELVATLAKRYNMDPVTTDRCLRFAVTTLHKVEKWGAEMSAQV